jgi:hypothetical protein
MICLGLMAFLPSIAGKEFEWECLLLVLTTTMASMAI